MVRLLTLSVLLVTATSADAQLLRRLFGRDECPAPVCKGPNCGQPSAPLFVPAQVPAPKPLPPAKPKVIGQALKAEPMTAQQVGAGFCVLVRAKARAEYRKQGLSVLESWKKSADLTDEVIRAAMPDAVKLAGVALPAGGLGDGTFLQKLLDFLASPAGQAIIDILLKLLMGLV